MTLTADHLLSDLNIKQFQIKNFKFQKVVASTVRVKTVRDDGLLKVVTANSREILIFPQTKFVNF